MPLPVTSCADDVVEDGKKFYYVVRAISANGVISVGSNTVLARIPNGKPINPAKITAPLCRDSADHK